MEILGDAVVVVLLILFFYKIILWAAKAVIVRCVDAYQAANMPELTEKEDVKDEPDAKRGPRRDKSN